MPTINQFYFLNGILKITNIEEYLTIDVFKINSGIGV